MHIREVNEEEEKKNPNKDRSLAGKTHNGKEKSPEKQTEKVHKKEYKTAKNKKNKKKINTKKRRKTPLTVPRLCFSKQEDFPFCAQRVCRRRNKRKKNNEGFGLCFWYCFDFSVQKHTHTHVFSFNNSITTIKISLLVEGRKVATFTNLCFN